MGRFFALPEKIRFLIAGGWNTLVGYLLFMAIYALIGDAVHYLVVLVIAHLLAVMNAIVTLKYLVFRSAAAFWPEYVRGNVSYAGVLAINAGLLWVMVDFAHWPVLMAQAIAVVVVTIGSYFAHKYFTFAKR